MSNYCIGDVHGRYDLLIMMLDKIKFDFNTDHVYLLGDVIDGGKGSVRILEYVMEHQESITLLRGNHEENFLFNKYGVEGIYGQLMQVVYTATAFSNIDSVQFLIEGAKQEYLGEGVYVGAPLPRSVFR